MRCSPILAAAAAVSLLSAADALRVDGVTRRSVVLGGAAAAVTSSPLLPALAADGKTGLDEYLELLPPKAKQAYLQYLPQLQQDGDFFVFELMPLLSEPGKWDRISALTTSTDIGSAASVSRLDREFISDAHPRLAFPPDMGGDEMISSIDDFQKAMFTLSKQARRGATTGNTAGPTSKEVQEVEASWDKGASRQHLFHVDQHGDGLNRLATIPAKGKGYGRSKTLYTQLLKDAALCRNRGGEALAGVWGQLMVYAVPGVNPCGSSAEKYFSRGL